MQLHCRLRSCFQRISSLLLETSRQGRYRVAIAGRSMAANPRRCNKGGGQGAKNKTGQQCPHCLSARWDGSTMLFFRNPTHIQQTWQRAYTSGSSAAQDTSRTQTSMGRRLATGQSVRTTHTRTTNHHCCT